MKTGFSADSVPETVRAWLQPIDGGSEVRVDGKDEAIHLRQLLVRHGWHCTFPIATWKRSQYVFHITRSETQTHADVERAVVQYGGAELQARNAT